jgi:hypothetical protein
MGSSGDFVTFNFSGVGLLAPHPTPNLEGQGLHFVRPIPFDLSVMSALPGAYAPASIALQVIVVGRPTLHVKAVVLAEVSMAIGMYRLSFGTPIRIGRLLDP